MSLCPESEYRASLSDAEFWEHVFHRGEPEQWETANEPPEASTFEPCPECGSFYACGYDAEGRAMIHVTPEDDS